MDIKTELDNNDDEASDESVMIEHLSEINNYTSCVVLDIQCVKKLLAKKSRKLKIA